MLRRQDYLDEPVEQLSALLDLLLGVGGEARQCVEHEREVRQRVASRDLQHVEQRLRGLVAHARLALAEARHDRVHQLRQVVDAALQHTPVYQSVV